MMMSFNLSMKWYIRSEVEGMAAVETSIQALRHSLKWYRTHRHSQRAKVFAFHARNSLLHLQSGVPGRVRYWSDFKYDSMVAGHDKILNGLHVSGFKCRTFEL